jgi:hypothetical protein
VGKGSSLVSLSFYMEIWCKECVKVREKTGWILEGKEWCFGECNHEDY